MSAASFEGENWAIFAGDAAPTKSMFTPHRDSRRTISFTSAPPLDVPCAVGQQTEWWYFPSEREASLGAETDQ